MTLGALTYQLVMWFVDLAGTLVLGSMWQDFKFYVTLTVVFTSGIIALSTMLYLQKSLSFLLAVPNALCKMAFRVWPGASDTPPPNLGLSQWRGADFAEHKPSVTAFHPGSWLPSLASGMQLVWWGENTPRSPLSDLFIDEGIHGRSVQNLSLIHI